MSQNAHPLVLSRGSGAGGTTGLGHSVINPPGSTTMNLSSSPSSVSWSHVNNGASASGASASTQQQQDAKTVPSPQNSNQSGTTLKEHDLLGLSEVSSSTTRGSQSPVQDNLSDEGSDFEELNLKMELGPPAARKISYPRSAPEQQQPAPVTSESGNSHGGSDGSLQTSEQGAAVVEKSSPNAEQNGAANEQQQQQVDRGLSYGAQGGRADAARPLIDSEALMKWHAEQVGDRKTSNEGVGGLRLGISLHSQRGATQDGVSEKKVFLNSTDRNREPEPKQQQEDTSWQQERSFQEDVPTMEKTQERPSVVQEQHQVVAKQQQQQQLERQKQQQQEAYNQMIEKRPLMERKTLPALQQPEQRFAQNVPERSPRLPPTEPANRLWSNQMKYRECLVSSTPDYQTQHSAQQDLDSRVGYSVSAGNFASNRNMYAGPKLGVTGAKRNFDAITGSDARNVNEARSGLPGPLSVAGGPMNTSNGSSSEAEAKALCQQQIKVQNGMPMYPWGQKNAIPTPSSWHMLEQSGGSFGPFPSQPQRPSRAPVSKNASEVISGAGVDTKTWDGQPKGHQEIVSTTPQQKMSAPTEAKQSTNDAAPAPPVDAASAAPRAAAAPAAVGWPPLRSFRKNLAVTPRPVPSETPSPRLNAPQQPAPAPSVAGQSNSWFVKVHMDGVPIGRKVDLRTNSSYDKLSQMLDEMFRSFVNGQNGPNRITLASDHKRNFLQGPDYVLTYEDQDGDLMLVGDVPWAMFIDTVKRLRIMKGSEAIGLGTRAAEKANKAPQPNV